MYRFTRDVHSLATGKTHKKGSIVPPTFLITEFMINAGAIEKIEVQAQDYSEMTVPELRDLLRRRELPVSGNKDQLIDRLLKGEGEHD